MTLPGARGKSEALMTSGRWVAIRNIVETQFLSIEAYDEAERRALVEAPNSIVACCQPTTFAILGYPIRIHTTGAAGDCARAEARLIIAHDDVPVSVFVHNDSRDAREGLSLPADGSNVEIWHRPPVLENPERSIWTALRRSVAGPRTRAGYDLAAVDAMSSEVLARHELETIDELFGRCVYRSRRGVTC